MNLLVDANLSFRLIRKLEPGFPEVLHVERTGQFPPRISNMELGESEAVKIVVLGDNDFHRLASRHGFPPKVVLLRTGNQSTTSIAEILIRHKTELEQLHHSSDYGLLELL